MRAVVVLAVLAACGGTTRQGQVAAARRDGCARAAALQRSAGELARAGSVREALHALDRAAPMCPARRARAWQLELELLAELDLIQRLERLVARARGLEELAAAVAAAGRVLAERAAWTADPVRARDVFAAAGKAEATGDLEAAQRGYLEAWRLSRPNGDVLVRAAAVARRRGDAVEARRLADRALSDLERESGPAHVVAGPPDVADWGDPLFSPDEQWLAYPAEGEIAVVHAPTGEVRRWLPHPADSNVRFTDDSKRIIIGEREAEPPEEDDPMASEEAPPAPDLVEVVEWELESPWSTRRMEPPTPAPPAVDPRTPAAAPGDAWVGWSNGSLAVRYPGQREATQLDGVSCIAIDPSSRTQAVVGRWQTKDLATMSLERPAPHSAAFFSHDSRCEELFFAPDGRHLIVRLDAEDGTTRVVAMEWPGRKVVLDVAVKLDVRSVTLRQHGALLAIEGHYGQSQLRTFPGGALVLEPRAPTFSPSERRVAFQCGESERCVVDLARPQEVVRFGLAARSERAALTGDGALWVTRQDGSLRWIDLARGTHGVLRGAGEPIADLQVSDDGARALTRGAGAVTVWDTRARRAQQALPGAADLAQLSRDGTSVVLLAGGEVRVHDRAGAVTRRFRVPTQVDEYSKEPELPEVWLAPGGDRIATLLDPGRTPNEVRFLSTADGRQIGSVARERARTSTVLFLPDGDRALVVAMDPGPGAGATQHTRVRALAAAPAGRRGCATFIWSVARSIDPRSFEGCGAVALSGDGRRLAIAGHDMVEVLELATGLTVAVLPVPQPYQVSLDRTGQRAAVVSRTDVRLFDVRRERELGRLSPAGDGWLVESSDGAIRRLGGVAPACRAGTRTYPFELCAPAQ
ncbi:MAG TPA: WD40 repeat domain-containing protein [Kofleriaceae bacterium]|nr:WD40 repeat domain-containing protein [Kofleriaceae bacterium]